MGILNSVALGKSRNSAGNITFYNRIGVGCFRQKAGVSPNYKPSVAQQMQQKVFKFIKANIDASGVMALLRLTYDAKPKAGKSQTMYNMFYKSFTPHIVMQKPAIYDLTEDEMVNPSIFIGAPAAHNDIFSNGILGALAVDSASHDKVTIDAVVLENLVQKANSLLSANDTPFTINDCFVSLFGASNSAENGYEIVFPANVVPSLAEGIYTLDISALTGSLSTSAASYMVLTLAKKSGASMDSTKRMFSTDSIELIPPQAVQVNSRFSAAGGSGNNPTGEFPISDLTAAGLTVEQLAGIKFNGQTDQGACTATITKKDGTTATLTCTTPQAFDSIGLVDEPCTFTSEDGKIVIHFSNEIGNVF